MNASKRGPMRGDSKLGLGAAEIMLRDRVRFPGYSMVRVRVRVKHLVKSSLGILKSAIDTVEPGYSRWV